MNATVVTSRPRISHLPRRLVQGGGFTLVELVAIMVILAIVAGAAAATFNSLAGARSAAAANHLLSDLTHARQRAIAQGTVVWVDIDEQSQSHAGQWSLLIEQPGNPGRANAALVLDMATGRPHVIQIDHLFKQASVVSADFDGHSRIGFDWLGQPLVDDDTPLQSQGTVMLSGNHVLSVEPTTGYARIEP